MYHCPKCRQGFETLLALGVHFEAQTACRAYAELLLQQAGLKKEAAPRHET